MARPGIVACTSVYAAPVMFAFASVSVVYWSSQTLDGLQQQVETGRDGDLDARGLGDEHLAAAHPDGSVEVARRHSEQQGDEHDGGGEAEHGVEERQVEEVERDVEVELRVGGSRRGAVQPERCELPARGCRHSGEQAEQHRDAPHGEAAQRLDDLLVAVELRVELGVDRARPVGDLDGDPDRHGHGDEPDEEHRCAGDPLRGEHREESEIVEPQHVGVDAREDEERHHEGGDDHDRDDEGCPSTAIGRVGGG